MKKSKFSFLILSLPAAAVMFPYSLAHAAIRVTNSSAIQTQMQQNAAQASQQDAARYATQTPQPARTVTNNNNGGTNAAVSAEQMDLCQSIYPNGIFEWVRPTSGRMAGGPATCAALVEMRAYNAAGTTYTVLANTYLAAGDNLKCNIDNFPNITTAGRDFTYPADSAPTIEEVEKVMAQENKANAGFKILAATVVGGIGGNLLGKGKSGDDSPLGVGGDKLKTTAIGAATAAAVMTASTQVNDYKTGSMILSTGINTAAGAVAGNVMASGEEVLQISKCKIEDVETTCLYGSISGGTGTEKKSGKNEKAYFYDIDNGGFLECTQEKDEYTKCHSINLIKVVFDHKELISGNTITYDPDTDINKYCQYESKDYNQKTCKEKLLEQTDSLFGFSDSDAKRTIYERTLIQTKDNQTNQKYFKIVSGETAGARTTALIKWADIADKWKDYSKYQNSDKLFGYKRTDWYDIRKGLDDSIKMYDAYGNELTGATLSQFSPAYLSATDGDVVDINNKARTKSTLVGAAGGAGLGALSGAAGADAAIQERLNTAIREYEDSLGNIACSTGGRYLSKYNDLIIIPEMKSE